MSNPWDRLPFPKKGDDHEDTTYTGVGRVLSAWEMAETELSHLYAIFTGRYQESVAYDDYYDDAQTTRKRIASVSRAADWCYFVHRPNQDAEGECHALLNSATRFSERRHEVAHGIVRPLQWYFATMPIDRPPHDLPFRFGVVPPHYQRDWFTKDGMPLYVYSSVELIVLQTRIASFVIDLIHLRHRLLGLMPWQSRP